jgi:hypothetical protein
MTAKERYDMARTETVMSMHDDADGAECEKKSMNGAKR